MTSEVSSIESPAALLARAEAVKASQPNLRPRALATELGVSEAELIDARVGGDVVRLVPDMKVLLEQIPAVGRIMTLTRNEAAVHERRGTYNKGEVHGGHVGLVVGKDIDLRLFPSHWHCGYRVVVTAGSRTLDSMQFFDRHGTAVQKIYAEGMTDKDAWNALVEELTHADQTAGQLTVEPAPAPPSAAIPSDFDRAAFLESWSKLRDTHHFYGLLRKNKLVAGAAFQAAEGEYTARLPDDISETLLEKVAEEKLPIMVFVGSRGCIQIHTGPVRRILARNGWTNVLDPDFNLHLREEEVHSAWAVTKPTDDGPVTSVELLDANGAVLVRFFGARKPGIPELPRWRSIVQSLPTRAPSHSP
jgi:putative hemin transport protein